MPKPKSAKKIKAKIKKVKRKVPRKKKGAKIGKVKRIGQVNHQAMQKQSTASVKQQLREVY